MCRDMYVLSQQIFSNHFLFRPTANLRDLWSFRLSITQLPVTTQALIVRAAAAQPTRLFTERRFNKDHWLLSLTSLIRDAAACSRHTHRTHTPQQCVCELRELRDGLRGSTVAMLNPRLHLIYVFASQILWQDVDWNWRLTRTV